MSTYTSIRHRLSKILQPIIAFSKNNEIKRKELTSKSQKLMLDLGIIKQANPGCYHLLPLGVKSLEKLVELVNNAMKNIGGQKIIFPTLIESKLWQITERLEKTSSELFTLNDRHNHYFILSPTHEEVAADFLSKLGQISYRDLPLRLYQITDKFRDEIKPRFGLMRSRQFLMKDLYCFDNDEENARKSYQEMCETYDNFFKKIGVDFLKVVGNNGEIGGLLSHEYHYETNIGEDRILNCLKCNEKVNAELILNKACPKCNSEDIKITNGIEVGHTFLLGDKYSRPLNATYLNNKSSPVILQMGSYGLGLSRILAATLEVLSEEDALRWPPILAPYNILLIPPKRGSKEESIAETICKNLFEKIENLPNMIDNILLDDRTDLTIGRRYLDAKRMGYSYIIVLGKTITEQPVLFELTDLLKNNQIFLNESQLLDYIKQNLCCQTFH